MQDKYMAPPPPKKKKKKKKKKMFFANFSKYRFQNKSQGF